MEQIKELIEKMISQTSLSFDRLPDIDLYMDQVIEYLSRSSISERENDKLSSAMINNYIKDGLLPRANDKKYGREHLAYLMMIARLKQTLSVKDTGILLKAETEGKNIPEYFDAFQNLLSDTARALELSLPDDENELSAVALRLAISGYVTRIVCELILSRLESKVVIPAEALPEPVVPEKPEQKKEKGEQKKGKSEEKEKKGKPEKEGADKKAKAPDKKGKSSDKKAKSSDKKGKTDPKTDKKEKK